MEEEHREVLAESESADAQEGRGTMKVMCEWAEKCPVRDKCGHGREHEVQLFSRFGKHGVYTCDSVQIECDILRQALQDQAPPGCHVDISQCVCKEVPHV